MNLLGEGFHKNIIGQINQRQKVYGSGYTSGNSRSPEEIVYLNANTAWCKLVSSVDIVDPKLLQDKSLQTIQKIENNNLAKQFILFNGTDNIDNQSLRFGIATDKDILGNNSNAFGPSNNWRKSVVVYDNSYTPIMAQCENSIEIFLKTIEIELESKSEKSKINREFFDLRTIF